MIVVPKIQITWPNIDQFIALCATKIQKLSKHFIQIIKR